MNKRLQIESVRFIVFLLVVLTMLVAGRKADSQGQQYQEADKHVHDLYRQELQLVSEGAYGDTDAKFGKLTAVQDEIARWQAMRSAQASKSNTYHFVAFIGMAAATAIVVVWLMRIIPRRRQS